MNDVLKTYSQPKFIDEAINTIDEQTHGFNPYLWRPKNMNTLEKMVADALDKIYAEEMTAEMLKGQAFGL